MEKTPNNNVDPYSYERKRIEILMSIKNVSEFEINIQAAPVGHPNLLGSIHEIKISGKDENGEPVEYNWILKKATLVEVIRKYAQVDRLFKKEIFVYEKLLPVLIELERENNILEPFAVTPTLHLSFTETYRESLIMDDMRCLGFTSLKSSEPCSHTHATLAMKMFGKLHALSYALREHKPDEYKNFAEYAKNKFNKLANVETYGKHQRICCERVLQVLNVSSKDKEMVKTFKKFMEKSFDYQMEAIKLGSMGPYAVLTHGDAMIENIMFKNGDPDRPNIPTEICLLDWQFIRLGSPAFDLSQFIFLTTDKQFRDRYYDELIRTYYYSLCTHLTELKCDAEKILPYHILLLQLKRFSLYGLCMATMILHIVITDDNNNNKKEINTQLDSPIAAFESGVNPSCDKYKTRIRDIVNDYYEYGYFEFLN